MKTFQRSDRASPNVDDKAFSLSLSLSLFLPNQPRFATKQVTVDIAVSLLYESGAESQ